MWLDYFVPAFFFRDPKIGLFVVSIVWFFYMIVRLPKDIATLRDSYGEFRRREIPHGKTPFTEDDWKPYTSRSALDFWGHVAVFVFFTILLILAFLYSASFITIVVKKMLPYF